MAASIVDLFIHHHGSFSGPDLEYVGGDVMRVEGLDADKLCFGDITTILEVYLEYNYNDIPRLRLYYKYDDESNDYIRGLTEDNEIINILKEVASGKKNRLHIFVNDAKVEEVPFEVKSPVMMSSQSPAKVYVEEPPQEHVQEHPEEHQAAKQKSVKLQQDAQQKTAKQKQPKKQFHIEGEDEMDLSDFEVTDGEEDISVEAKEDTMKWFQSWYETKTSKNVGDNSNQPDIFLPKLALQQLKDSILEGSPPYSDYLKEKSGLAFTNAGDRILTDNGNHNPLTWRVNGSCFDAQHIGASKLLESNPHDGNLLPSKRKKNALATENMVGDFHEHQNILNDCGDPYINAKKQKQSTTSSSQSIEENSVPVHATELLEHLSESNIPVVQQEGQIGTLEEGRVTGDVNDEYTASMRCGHSSDDELHRIQSEIPDSATMMHPDTCGDEPHQNISVDEVKDDSEHCAERRTLTGSLPPYSATMMGQDTSVDEPCQKNSIDEVRDGSEQRTEPRTSSGPLLEKTRENESQCNFEHDVLLKAPHAASLDGAQQKIIDYEAEEDMDHCCEAGISSDSDGSHKDHIDVSMKKHDFLSSQCTFSHDSLAGWTDTNLCVKCNEGGQLLVCNTSHCPLVVHDICLGSSPRFDNNGNFYCPFCDYSLAISEYLEAKKNASLARKELTKFVRAGLENQQKEVLERLHREKHSLSRQNEDEDPLVKSHENDQTEDTSEDEKNKSIISNYSIRVRRQEMHYKYPVSPKLEAKEGSMDSRGGRDTKGGNAEIFKRQ